MQALLAGNIAHIDRTFTRTGSASVSGSTAAIAVTDPSGSTTALSETITIDNTAGTVRVEADWTIADNAAGGWYVISYDIGTAMVAAFEERVYVQARSLPTVP